MRVLRVIASMDPESGGPCQGIRNTVKAMEARSIENEVVCLDPPDAPFLEKDNFQIHALGAAKRPWGYSSKLSPWLLANLPRFDAIMVHGLWLYPTFAVSTARKTLSRKAGSAPLPPVFIMPHGMLDPYFQNAPGRRLKALRNRWYWKMIESKCIEAADGLLFTTEEEMKLAKTTFKPYRPKSTVNIGYGIQAPPPFKQAMTAAYNKACGQELDAPYLLFLSRIHPKKGVDLLLKAYAKCVQDQSQTAAKPPMLVIAGPGIKSDYGKLLLSEIKTSGLDPKHILFPGMLKGDAKWGAFYGCEAFVLPSHQENFGIVIAEALACGKPVLTTDKVNIWREIKSEDAGFIASDNQDGVDQVLRSWIGLGEVSKKEFSVRAKGCFERHFAIDSNIDKLITVLESHSVLSENRI